MRLKKPTIKGVKKVAMKAVKPVVACCNAIEKAIESFRESPDTEQLISSRTNSVRGSMRKQQNSMQGSTTSAWMTTVALVILNSDYNPSSDHINLSGVKVDGDLMNKMLSNYDKVEMLRNISNIEEAVINFRKKYNHVERLHFHYSGHGVDNAEVEIDPHSYSKTDGRKTYSSLTTYGECMVGCDGDLYSVHDLKHELLKCHPAQLTLTLDCCRNSRGGNKETVRLREKTPISKANQKKIAVIYGTSNLHTACDTNSFTRELHKVYEEEGGNIPFLEIVSKVNKSWEDRQINQICKHDIIEVGDNWRNCMWPDVYTIKAQKENTSCQGSMVTGTKRKERPDDEMTLEEVVKKLKTESAEMEEKLETEKQADKERIQKLESKVSELSEFNVSRKRVVRIPSNPKRQFHNTNFTRV